MINKSTKITLVCFAVSICFGLVKCEKDSSGIESISSKLAQMLNLIPSVKAWPDTSEIPENLKDDKHGVKMGISSDECDNGKDRLDIDWDGSPINYTCFTPKIALPVIEDFEPLITCDTIPPGYVPLHHCMDQPLHYKEEIPTHEAHRPLWPVYGEYEFVPPQRWLHTLEHGGIVMLYHPCADRLEVQRLKTLVRSCIWKHVITPWNLMSQEMPLALVAWGCRLQMTTVNPSAVRYFIHSKAFQGPEGLHPKQGQYSIGLKKQSDYPDDPGNRRITC